MKTKTVTRIVSLGIAVVAVLSLAACSDSALKFANETPVTGSANVPPPECLLAMADQTEIDAGGSATISYRIAGADSVSVSCLSQDGQFQFNAGPLTELEGTVTVDDIPSTTDCTVSATKAAASSEAPAESSGSKDLLIPVSGGDGPAADASAAVTKSCPTITIAVAGSNQLTVDVTADQTEVTPGEQTILRWSVSPDTASTCHGNSVSIKTTSRPSTCVIRNRTLNKQFNRFS